MSAHLWLPTTEFAQLAGISRQAAGKALRESLRGQEWNGTQLEVRPAIARGGRSGLVYEVRSDTLPRRLRSPLRERLATPLRRTTPSSAARLHDRVEFVAQILARPVRSPERHEAISTALLAADCSLRTLYRWMRLYEEHGVRGLCRARPSNAGERRVWVSRIFDRAARDAGLSDTALAEAAADIEKSIKGLWASRAEQAGVTELRRLAEFLLYEQCTQQGLKIPKSACGLSRRFVERFAHYRTVNRKRNDRKAYDDAKPRIRRDWTGLDPMERVVADVKHLDVVVRRDDGSTAWPKIVAFMDAGTGRVFVYPVLLEKGEGVRREHVIEAFLAMVSDPGWGFPQGLYLDNGSEFGALERIDHALQQINEPGARTVIYARPYNAAAKPIESLFARLDRYVFSQMPGYGGPNRMAAKTQTLGKPPRPYPGSWEEFCSTIQKLIGAYNLRPVDGLWKDRSPIDWLDEKQTDGWRPVLVEHRLLDAAFCTRDSRRVDRGTIKVGGERFYHPKLNSVSPRAVVDLAIPWRRGATPLANVDGSWVHLERDTPVPAQWAQGAREAASRQKAHGRSVKDLARDAGRIDPVATRIRWSEHQVRDPPPKARGGIDLGSEITRLGRQMTPSPAAPADPAELRRRREKAITERLEREQRGDH